MEKLISSTGIDSRILVFVAVQKTSLGISVVFEDSPRVMEKLCALNQDEIFVSLLGLRTTSGSLDHSTTRTKVYDAKAILTLMQDITTNGIFHFLLVYEFELFN